jgi:hypothetical protein
MRPAGLTAVCIITLCFGVLGGFSLFGGCLSIAAQPLMLKFVGGATQKLVSANTPQMQQKLEQQQAVMKETLAVQRQWLPFMIVGLVILAVAVVSLIVGAIKGLNLRPMAHRWMITGMTAAIVHAFISTFVAYRTQMESQEISFRHFNQALQTTPGATNPAAQAMANNMMQVGTSLGLVVIFGWTLLKCGYYLIAIWYLLTLRIRQLFESDGSDQAVIDALSDAPT